MKISKSELKKMIMEILDDEVPAQNQKTDVEKATKRMDNIQGLDSLLAKIDNRVELEQLLIQLMEKTNVKTADIYTAFLKAAKAAQSKVKGS